MGRGMAITLCRCGQTPLLQEMLCDQCDKERCLFNPHLYWRKGLMLSFALHACVESNLLPSHTPTICDTSPFCNKQKGPQLNSQLCIHHPNTTRPQNTLEPAVMIWIFFPCLSNLFFSPSISSLFFPLQAIFEHNARHVIIAYC